MAGEFVARLIEDGEAIRHFGQVALVTTEHLGVVRRKLVSRAGFEVVDVPLSQCEAVKHFDERPLSTIVSGVLLVGLVAAIVVLLALNWNELAPDQRVPVSAIALAGVYGVRRVFGGRRHRLLFVLRDGTTLRWVSRPGGYAVKAPAVQQLLAFARQRGLLLVDHVTVR